MEGYMKEIFFLGLGEGKIYLESVWGVVYCICRICICRNKLFEDICFRLYYKNWMLVWIKNIVYGRK